MITRLSCKSSHEMLFWMFWDVYLLANGVFNK
jgi:hypothetical protein